MSNTTTLPIFFIPELSAMIVQHLTRHDIAMLMATCKRLYYALESLLWRHVIINKRVPDYETLMRNRRHIETLDVGAYADYIYNILASQLSPLESDGPMTPRLHPSIVAATAVTATVSLREFTIPEYSLKAPVIVIQAFSILSHSPRLVKLHLPCDILDDYFDGVFDTIAHRLPQLRSLSIAGRSTWQKNVPKLLHACFHHQQLTECEFQFYCEMSTEKEFDSIVHSSGLTETVASRSNIQSIELPSAKYPTSYLVRLLNNCPNLERLKLPSIKIDGDKKLDFSSQRWCTNLQHITCSGRSQLNEYFLICILEGSSKGAGIKTFHIEEWNPTSTTVLNVLKMDHSTTLMDIKVTDSRSLSYEDIHGLLKECEKLEKLWIRFKKLSTNRIFGDWACLNLKELFLMFDPPENEARVINISTARNAFEQIGRLTKLETLTLGWRGVECLYLSAMAPEEHANRQQNIVDFESLGGLQNLRHFRMASNCWKDIGQAEVVFMNRQWPYLKEITTKTRIILKNSPHWRWMRKQRRYLKFSHNAPYL